LIEGEGIGERLSGGLRLQKVWIRSLCDLKIFDWNRV